MPDTAALLHDLHEESESLDGLIAPLDSSGWDTPTPAQGWTVRDAVIHLHRSDLAAHVSLDEGDLMATIEGVLLPSYAASDVQLLSDWRSARRDLEKRLGGLPEGMRIPWYGPPMGIPSFITARLMETWAHGEDVADALGVARAATGRLRHICELGFRTRFWSYYVVSRTPPDVPVRVELAAPGGETWSWGRPDAEESIRGSALDFALLVTQRRHRDDLALSAEGAAAQEWIAIAQAFAGPPGAGRAPL